MEKAREFQKNIYFCFIHYAKAFDCVDHNKLWKILKEMGIPDHLTCHLRNLYPGQEATVRTGHGTTDWFQIGKGVHQGCVLFLLWLHPFILFGKLSSGHRPGKGQFSSQSQRMAMPKNAQTTAQLHSSHMLVYFTILEILQARLQQYVNRELLDVQAGFRKGRGTRDQIANIHWIMEKESSRKTSISALFTMSKPLTVWIRDRKSVV